MTGFPDNWRDLRVALCHDWLTGMRGGERVLELLCRGFPAAPLSTLLHNRASVSEAINARRIETSWLNGVPGIARHYRWLLPLFPAAIETMRCPPADLLISTSHCVAKALPHDKATRHLCYCFTPMRYAWAFFEEYFGGSAARRLAGRLMLGPLRAWDRATASRVDRFVAISKFIQERIRACYGRESDVVYPPVNTEAWTPGAEPRAGGFDLVVSALVPYKRVDLAVRAYTASGFPLTVVGVGTERTRLAREAGANVRFVGWLSDPEIRELYRSCRLLVFPGVEDFGIVPLEAQCCGAPVVAYAAGGALETLVDGVSGVFFREPTESSLRDAVERCAKIRWDTGAVRACAERFGVGPFLAGLDACIREEVAGRK